MKILFLSSEGFDTPNSINHLCETLLEDILLSGIEVHSITSHKTGEYDDIPQSLMTKAGFSYDIIRRKIINRNNFVLRYLDEIRYAFSARKIWNKKRREFDAVILQSNPNSVVNALLLNMSIKIPVILNLYDVFPGHAMSIGVIKHKIIYYILQKIQRVLYKNCTFIVAMSDDMKKQLIAEKVPDYKIRVINNWFDSSVFLPIDRDKNRFFEKYQLDITKFYVQFAGLLGYVFDYKMYLDVAQKLIAKDDIVFLLIGDGNQKDTIVSEIERRNLTNIKYFPWQPLSLIADVYNACDIGIIPLKPGVIGNGIPSKACQLMAARRVIINAVEESDYTRLFEQYEMGINVLDYSAEEVSKVILCLYENPCKCKTIGDNAYEYAFCNYSRKQNTSQFIDLIRESVSR